MKVCEKVKQKGTTTYNQVADELVNEYCSYTSSGSTKDLLSATASNLDLWNYDQKNVRRRVYDALNVLMAMNIISKEKKEIKWIGLPCNKKQECQELEVEKKEKEKRIQEKTEILKNLILEVGFYFLKNKINKLWTLDSKAGLYHCRKLNSAHFNTKYWHISSYLLK